MPSHFVGLQRGVEGSDYNDFITGVATNATQTIELRIDDTAGYRPADLAKALEAFRRFLANQQQWSSAGFVING